jgi:hypothetical protein
MSLPVLTALGFAVLGVAGLPLALLRQAVLHLGWFSVRLALAVIAPLAAVCAYQPELVPVPLAARVVALLPHAAPELRWLALAAVLVLAGLPLVVFLDHARRLARHTALVEQLRRDLDTFRAESHTVAPAPCRKPVAAPPRLVKDVLHDLLSEAN